VAGVVGGFWGYIVEQYEMMNHVTHFLKKLT
jgi:hypothetical protein